MGKLVFARTIAAPIHPAEQYNRTIAKVCKSTDLCRVKRTLAGMRPCSKDGRQKKYRGASAIGLMDLPRIMDRGAMSQAPRQGTTGSSCMNAIGAPERSKGRRPGEKHAMPAPPRRLSDQFKSLPPRCFVQMIMAKDYSATARHSLDRSLQPVVIALVGEQPYLRHRRAYRVRQNGGGLVSQHKHAYRRKLGERE